MDVMLNKYKFQFTDVSDKWKCKLCFRILINAKQTECGCRVCGQCIDEYLEDGPRQCPCGESTCVNHALFNVMNIFNDKATGRSISELEVLCPLHSCQFRSKLKSIGEHMASCEYRQITCKKCRKALIARDEQEHNMNLCEMRIVTCEYCHKKVKLNEMIPSHLNSDNEEMCSEYISTCPNNCNQKNQINIKNHLLVCFNKKQKCPFNLINCDTTDKLSKENLVNHFNENNLEHNTLLLQQMRSLESVIHDLRTDLDNIKSINNELLSISEKNNSEILKINNFIKNSEEFLENESRGRNCHGHLNMM